MKAFSPSESPAAVGPYNHGVRTGPLLFTAGQIPLDPQTNQLVEGNVRVQTQQVLDNLGSVLRHEGLDYANVVKCTIFLTDLEDFATVNEVYAAYFKEPFPARSCVQVAALPKGARVEIEGIAEYPA